MQKPELVPLFCTAQSVVSAERNRRRYKSRLIDAMFHNLCMKNTSQREEEFGLDWQTMQLHQCRKNVVTWRQAQDESSCSVLHLMTDKH